MFYKEAYDYFALEYTYKKLYFSPKNIMYNTFLFFIDLTIVFLMGTIFVNCSLPILLLYGIKNCYFSLSLKIYLMIIIEFIIFLFCLYKEMKNIYKENGWFLQKKYKNIFIFKDSILDNYIKENIKDEKWEKDYFDSVRKLI
jgi:hypothetical protein